MTKYKILKGWGDYKEGDEFNAGQAHPLPENEGEGYVMLPHEIALLEHCGFITPVVEEKKEKKGEYVLIDGRKPRWKLPDGTLVSYIHQDDNFSNLCSSDYCRCSQ